jgi:hypothetical protein
MDACEVARMADYKLDEVDRPKAFGNKFSQKFCAVSRASPGTKPH